MHDCLKRLIENGKRRVTVVARLYAAGQLPPLPGEPTYCRSNGRWPITVDRFGGRSNAILKPKFPR